MRTRLKKVIRIRFFSPLFVSKKGNKQEWHYTNHFLIELYGPTKTEKIRIIKCVGALSDLAQVALGEYFQ